MFETILDGDNVKTIHSGAITERDLQKHKKILKDIGIYTLDLGKCIIQGVVAGALGGGV